ncbi:MAG: thymidine phosphorylase [Candidatus Aenigmarchaeota archaeon]|nr:thymidine phosphorylase [Candidatus Aenigmarchaeota archaeon]MDW8149051.1 thymidine phosphorylase [Candidatus Aenigmarchaeota archaeon]
MLLKVKILDIFSGKPIVVLNKKNFEELEIIGNRIKIVYKNHEIIASVNISESLIEKGEIGVYRDVAQNYSIKNGELVEVVESGIPESLTAIKNKIAGRRLDYKEIYSIIKDVVSGNLSDIEITALIVALNSFGMTIDEAANFARAMVETGRTLKLDSKIILDKHSVGGLSGDKTSLILVPLIASLGYKIPKTSSRAITSAAGTADKASVLMNVNLTIEEMEEVVKKTNGCLVWGGTLHLAPADDVFIRYEYVIGLDPFLLPSIMAKKKAVGATHVVIDIPTGRGVKVKSIGDAEILAKDFLEISKLLGIKVNICVTQGIQPIGYTIGPALEAKEALEFLMRKKDVRDLKNKTINIANALLNLVKRGNYFRAVENALNSNKAERKMREIIEAQGGNKNIKPSDIEIAKYYEDFVSEKDGFVLWIDSGSLNQVARILGCPKDLSAGIVLYKKIGDKVKIGDKILRLYSNSENRIDLALKVVKENGSIGIGKEYDMLIKILREAKMPKKYFILER